MQWSDAGMVLVLLLLGILLCFLGMGLLFQWQESTARHQGGSVDILLGGVTAAAGIILLLWWAVSILSAWASVLLERMGRRRAAASVRRLSPAFMQRAVVAALSIQLVTGVAANAAVMPGPEWTPTQAHATASAASNPAIPHPAPQATASNSPRGTPVQTQPLQADAPSAGREGPSPAWESSTAATVQELNPGWQPAPPVVEPGLLAAPEARTGAGPGLDDSGRGPGDTDGQARAVTVLAGDTLWDIVASYLGPDASDVDIALEWPRWFAANRALIGGSPDVLLPGQILHAPAVS
jgi:hypothetical protein